MIRVLTTDILSPLAAGSRQNYEALKEGRSSLQTLQGWHGIKDPFCACVFSAQQDEAMHIEGFTRFESMVINSVGRALGKLEGKLDLERTVFILSTTKADILELGSSEDRDGNYHRPAESAERVAAYFGIPAPAIVSCNACISGTSAQILADRLISAGCYDYAVVCGADCVTPFAASGFMSFRSLSQQPCRPFDLERTGLNLGEAAATIIFGKSDAEHAGGWSLVGGSLSNDAYHLSAPSPVGEGSVNAITKALGDFDPQNLAFVNAHGTATMFNDQMESVAICKAGLGQVPVSAVKGWYGHTLGASGVLESIISMEAVDDSTVLPVRGFEEMGVSGAINISASQRQTDKKAFLKMISGFGGCNAAALYTKGGAAEQSKGHCGCERGKEAGLGRDTDNCGKATCQHTVTLTESELFVDGERVQLHATGKDMLTEIYKNSGADYPKFYKMDIMSRVVYIASELLLHHNNVTADPGRAVILFNRTSSVVSDRNHLATIRDEENFYPSPSVFLYTLPNIVAGEVAIRNGIKAETSLYIIDRKDEKLMEQVISASMAASGARSMITGWVDCSDPEHFEAKLKLLTK